VSIQRKQNVIKLQVTVTTSTYVPPGKLRLAVPVDDSVCMEIFQCQQNFRRVELGLAERELLSLDVQHQVPPTHVLHDKVDTRLGLEARMQAK
jgi:hypothetical protein